MSEQQTNFKKAASGIFINSRRNTTPKLKGIINKLNRNHDNLEGRIEGLEDKLDAILLALNKKG